MPTYASRSLWTSAFVPPPPVFDPATLAWVAAVIANGGTVSGPREILVNDLIVGLKDDGVWLKQDRLWLYAAENQEAAQVDLVVNAIVTENSSPTFTPDEGYTGNGSTSFVDTTFTPSTASGVYVLDSAHMSVWATVPANNEIMGVDAGGGTNNIYQPSSGNLQFCGINETTVALSAAFSPGLVLVSRTASNAVALYNNGSSIDSDTDASTALPNEPIYVLARRQGGANIHSASQVAAASIGAGLNSTEQGNLYSRLRTYMTAVGVP